MKKLCSIILVLCIGLNTNAQLLKKLKDKLNNGTSPSQSTSSPESIKEEKIGKVMKTYTVKGKYGDVIFEIGENDELTYENKDAYGNTYLKYLRTGKKQYVYTSIELSSSNEALLGEKIVVDKSQIANCVQAIPGSIQQELRFYLTTEAKFKRAKQGETDSDMTETVLTINTNTVAKANAIQSKILGKEIGGTELNKFAYLTGDGTLIKTSAPSFWFFRDGALFFESVATEKALRVTYFEINEDLVWKKASYTVKVTNIPSDHIGDYKKIMIGSKDATLPLTRSVTKTIYKDQEKATTEEISDNFRITANDYYSGLIDTYCNIVIQQLPASDKDKFRKEVQQPLAAKKLAEEKERDRLYAESQRNSGASNTSKLQNSGSSKSSNQQKKEFYVTLRNKGKVKVKMEIKTAKSIGGLQFEMSQSTSRRIQVELGGRIFVNDVLIATITEGMNDKEIIVAQ